MADNFLFVYGTLLDDRNEFSIYLKKNSTFYTDGKFRGRLYDLGQYPAAVQDDTVNNYVYGKVYLLINPDDVLEKLDDYEGMGGNNNQPNEYIRESIAIDTNKGRVDGWVYLYNLPADGLEQIESGKYS